MTPQPSTSGAPLRAIRNHPWITGIYVVSTLAGIGLAVAWLPAEWALLRRAAAGAFGGAGCAWMMTVTRMLR